MQGSPEIFHYLCILMKLLKRIFILCAVVIGLTACGASKIKDISLTSVGVSYVVPTSSRSMDAKLILGIDNPAMAFTVQEVAGTIRYQDKELAHFVTGPVSLEAKCEKQYELLSKELRTTSQRVNLFEKVKIPESKDNIRKINIFLGDQQTSGVARSKLAKGKATAKALALDAQSKEVAA